jgi:hypothetical protein
MSLSIIAPTIAIAVNLPLAVWALVREPRNPSYRLFGLLAISLVVWNLGGEVFHLRPGGPPAVWVRLSLLGMAMVPANFLCLALTVRRNSAPGAYWHFLFYVPPMVLGFLLDPALVGSQAISPAWRSGFYRMSAPGAAAFGGLTAAYLLAALWISWRESRQGQTDRDWLFYLVQFPLVVGILCVMVTGYVRHERSPTVSLWAMAISQYTMFMMIRYGLVKLDLSLRRGITLAFVAVVLAACLLLAIALGGMLFGRALGQEMTLVLVVSMVSLCMLYAAVLPKLEELSGRLFQRSGGRDEPGPGRHTE